MKANVFMDGVRGFFAIIDGTIYSLISNVYELLLTLAKTSIFSEGNIRDFATRIYAFLGIIMLFKVTFSLISYLVNPDAISDKTTGAGNVAKNIIVTLFLIIIVPFGFDLLYQAQSAIINDELIPRLILGTKEDTLEGLSLVIDTEACKKIDDADKVIPTGEIRRNGDYIGLMAFRPFYQVYDEALEEFKGKEDLQLDYCSVSDVSQLLEGKNKNYGGFLWVFGDKYYFNYQFFISTAVGILILLLLINFTFDIAVRTIKLGFLEIVAPIPIISYIDPKTSKDGPFKKWLREVMNTWISLFLRLAVIFFAIYIIQVINENLKDLTDQGMWVMLFLIIGALMFAKQAVPLIEKILGVKFDHTVQLNPFKKVSDQALGGKVALGLGSAAGVVGMTAVGAVGANSINTFKNWNKIKEKNPDDKWAASKRLLSGVGNGIFVGGYRGMTMGYKAGANGKYNVFGTTMNAIEKNSSDRNLSESLIEQNVVGPGPFAKTRYVVKDKFSDVVGLQGKTGTTDELKDKLKQINVQISLAEDVRKQSDEFLTRFKQASSNIFRDIYQTYDPFNRSYKRDEKGNLILDKDGQVEWNKALVDYSKFIKENAINFNSSTEEMTFRRDYEAYYAEELKYRESFNEILKLQKQQKKLTKQEEEFKNSKIKASNSK